jgi:abortive infection bacteriophage resistance protein
MLNMSLASVRRCSPTSQAGDFFFPTPEGPYTPLKVHLTFEQQLALLKERGLEIESDTRCKAALQRLGYYRLVGYWYPLRKPRTDGVLGRLDKFQQGASFDAIERLYEFDKQLRLLVLDAIERIEVAVRVDVAYLLGKRHRFAHERPECLDANFTGQSKGKGRTRFTVWSEKLALSVANARDDFVAHHRHKYGGRMPIWVVIEVWDFGLLSKLFSGLQFKDQRKIAQRYGLPDGQYLASWLRALNFSRNVAAHHSRLWNRNVPEVPKIPPQSTHPILHHLHENPQRLRRVYGVLCLMRYLLRTIAPECDWHERLKMLSGTFPTNELLALEAAGFPLDWEKAQLWT